MCGHWKRKQKEYLYFEAFERFVNRLADRGLQTICFSGGDPLAHPHINDFMNYCVENYFDFGLVTAGFVPDEVDEETLSNAKWVRISLDAIDYDLYEKIRGGGVNLREVHYGLLTYLEIGVEVQLGITAHKYNIDHIPLIIDAMSGYPIKRIDIRPVYKHSKDLYPTEEQIKNLMANKWVNREGVNTDSFYFQIKPVNRCWASLYQWFIRSNGDVYPCCIIAGDTENKPKKSICFGKISEKIDDIYERAHKFSQSRSKDCLKICNRDCIERFWTINDIVEDVCQGEGYFF
jgi:MoaA/NifB/PqqE/SkfB family radical SAM enzyme